MRTKRPNLLTSLALIVAGVAGFFLFLFLTGRDPDEQPLTLSDWVIGGALLGPGFGSLLAWRRTRDRRDG